MTERWGNVKVIHKENGNLLETVVYEPSERELCISAEEAIRELAPQGLVSFIVNILDPDSRARVREYLTDVMTEIAHDMMEGI